MGSLDRLLELCGIDEALFPHLNKLTRDEEQEYQSLKSQIEKNQEIVDRLKELCKDGLKLPIGGQTMRVVHQYQYQGRKHFIERIQKILDGGEK